MDGVEGQIRANFPNELWTHCILPYVGEAKSLLNFGATCKTAVAVSKTDALWKTVCEHEKWPVEQSVEDGALQLVPPRMRLPARTTAPRPSASYRDFVLAGWQAEIDVHEAAGVLFGSGSQTASLASCVHGANPGMTQRVRMLPQGLSGDTLTKAVLLCSNAAVPHASEFADPADLAEKLWRLDRLEDAAELLEQAIANGAHRYPKLLFDLYAELGKFDSALALAERYPSGAFFAETVDAPVLAVLAGRYAAALESAEDPYTRSLALLGLGRFEDARTLAMTGFETTDPSRPVLETVARQNQGETVMPAQTRVRLPSLTEVLEDEAQQYLRQTCLLRSPRANNYVNCRGRLILAVEYQAAGHFAWAARLYEMLLESGVDGDLVRQGLSFCRHQTRR